MSKTSNENIESKETRVVRTRRMNNGANTILVTIPVRIRETYHLDQPTNILIVPTDNGILIKKLEMETMK